MCKSVSEGMVVPGTLWDKCLLTTKSFSFQVWVDSHLWTSCLLGNYPSGTERSASRINVSERKYKEEKVVQNSLGLGAGGGRGLLGKFLDFSFLICQQKSLENMIYQGLSNFNTLIQ